MIIGQNSRKGIMLAAVTSFQRTADFKQVVVYMADGGHEAYDAGEFDAALSNTVQASFEANGALLVRTLYDEDMKPCGVYTTAILGFYIDATGELRAVSMDGDFSDPTVLFADGHVEAFEENWKTIEEYERYVVSSAREQPLI